MGQLINLEDLNEFKNQMFNAIFPVGSIYTTTNNVNPGSVLGGTWINMKGVNLANPSTKQSDTQIDGSSGAVNTGANGYYSYFLAVEPNKTYTISNIPIEGAVLYSGTPGSSTFIKLMSGIRNGSSFTTTSTSAYFGFTLSDSVVNLPMLVEGSTLLPYSPYGDNSLTMKMMTSTNEKTPVVTGDKHSFNVGGVNMLFGYRYNGDTPTTQYLGLTGGALAETRTGTTSGNAVVPMNLWSDNSDLPTFELYVWQRIA